MARMCCSTSSREIRTSSPSRRPRANAKPALVVARAEKPSVVNMRAVPASQGFGMMKAPGPSWSGAKFLGFFDLRGVVTGDSWLVRNERKNAEQDAVNIVPSWSAQHAAPLQTQRRRLCHRVALRADDFFDAATGDVAILFGAAFGAAVELGFGRSAARNCATGRVLMTSAAVSQPRRAIVTP